MNILLAHKYWRPRGGAEEYAFLLKGVLEELGHRVIPLSTSDPANRSSPYARYFISPVKFGEGSPMAQLQGIGRALGGLATRRALGRLLENERIDVAHIVHVYHQMGSTFLPMLRANSIPTLLAIHDYKLCCPRYLLFDDSRSKICTVCLDDPRRKYVAPAAIGCWRGSRLGGVALAMEAAVSDALGTYRRNVDRVLVLNKLQERCAVAAGFPAERVQLIPNFWPMPERPPAREDLPYLLYVGRLSREKGVDVLVRAAAQARVTVRVVGDGPEHERLAGLAAALGAPVTFVGERSTDEVLAEMRSASGLVVPSRCAETSSFVILQAFATATPVLGAAVGAVTDLLADGRGWLVPLEAPTAMAEAMLSLLHDREAAKRRARMAFEYAATEFTRARFVERLRDAYNAVGRPL